ncbi:hypothetical protein [Streptomyces sp. NPDC005970]|uniref:hypothetical protein n=1 Tax=Streptomyces sp. NPDC005970 TaxID=3156723 RepID=UPI0033F830AC
MKRSRETAEFAAASRDRSTGRFRYQRIDGADGVDGVIDLPPGSKGPWGVLDIPGAARRLLLDGDQARVLALPHPPGPRGSRALREISEDTARRLLAAAATSQAALSTAVQSLLPEVGHPLLLRGIVGFVQAAASGIRTRHKILSRLKKVGTGTGT